MRGRILSIGLMGLMLIGCPLKPARTTTPYLPPQYSPPKQHQKTEIDTATLVLGAAENCASARKNAMLLGVTITNDNRGTGPCEIRIAGDAELVQRVIDNMGK